MYLGLRSGLILRFANFERVHAEEQPKCPTCFTKVCVHFTNGLGRAVLGPWAETVLNGRPDK